MSSWVLWVIAAAVFGAGELLSMGFFLAPFAAGALVAAGVAALGVGAGGEWVAFIVVSMLALWVVRPIARSHQGSGAGRIRTGTAKLIGSPAIVLERIDNDAALGCVRIAGEVWTARAYDDDQVFEVGSRVQVIEIRGATALVTD